MKLCESERIQVIVMRNSGHKYGRISCDLNISKAEVYKIYRRYQLQGTVQLQKPKGRPNKITPRDSHRIQRTVPQSPIPTSKS